jgi:8-hydroxy-5-deazaflavin:NADPH oxidoreductase
VRVAILGGTGPFGRALAQRLAEAGDDVTIGSRDAERARAAAGELGVRGRRNEDAVRHADLVVLAVDADAALATAEGLLAVLTAAPVLSVASRLEFADRQASPAGDAASLAEQVAGIVAAPVAAGLHSLAAGKLAKGRPDEDALVCGDDPEAKELALQLAGKVVAGRAIDAGPLAVARALEGVTAVLVNVNHRYKAHAGIRVTGLP